MSGGEEAVALHGPRGVLRGIRHAPDGRDTGWTAVLLQGFFSSTHVGPARLYVQLGRLLAAHGIETLRVDCFGVGDSDGDFAEATYATELEDYVAVVRYARSQASGPRRLLLLGHCLGASLALRLAAEGAAIEKLLLLSPACGAFSWPENVFSKEEQEELRRVGRTERKGTAIAGEFVDALQDPGIYGVARKVAAPTVVLFAESDEYFDRASAERLVAALPAGRLVLLAGADHNFLARGARARLLEAFEEELRRTR